MRSCPLVSAVVAYIALSGSAMACSSARGAGFAVSAEGKALTSAAIRMDLGATGPQTLRRIVIPLARPALA